LVLHCFLRHHLTPFSSHPNSPRYGQWYSADEIIELFAPPQKAVDSVRAWLEDAGIAAERISHSANKQWIQFDAKAHEAERLLRTKYFQYEHEATGSLHVACDEYHVPLHLSEHIDYITPGVKLLGGGKASGGRPLGGRKSTIEKRGFRTNGNQNFSSPVFGPALSSELLGILKINPLSSCDKYVTPECIMAMYNVTRGSKAAPGNELGIFEEGDFYAAEDLIEFFAAFAPYIPVTTRPKLEGIDGGFAPGLIAGGESDLDFQISCMSYVYLFMTVN
jgi:tripeptidyl-peptidase-1